MEHRRQIIPSRRLPVARRIAGIVTAGLLVVGPFRITRAQEAPPAQPPSPYIGADACKACHSGIYDAWAKTKHARAITRLSADDRGSGSCIGCHATGTPDQLRQEGGNPSFPGVQCEACHGPARAHAAAEAATPPVKSGLNKQPQTGVCERCHSSKSPHFQGFVYRAMVGLVHATGK